MIIYISSFVLHIVLMIIMKKNYINNIRTEGGWVGMGYVRKGLDWISLVNVNVNIKISLRPVSFLVKRSTHINMDLPLM